MEHYVRSESDSKEQFIHVYKGLTQDQLNQKIDDLLKSEGYKLKDGMPGNGTYEKGSRTARILLGAFYKYFKANATTQPGENEEIKLRFNKQTSGMSGGVIGMNQVKKEMERISNLLISI